MGEIEIKGPDALKFVNYLLTSRIIPGSKMIYGLLCNEKGFVIDDLMVYPMTSTNILLVVNASNKDKDLAWILQQSQSFNVSIDDISVATGEIALQGPNAESIIKQILETYPSHSLEYFESTYQGHRLLISRSGYTGEDGFEIYGNLDLISLMWDRFINLNVKPCGLGCRDTLRFEAA